MAYTYKGEMTDDTSISLEYGTTSICSYAFEGRAGLSSINIPSSLTDIDEYAFSGCNNLHTIEFHCREIGESWFKYNNNIKTIILGDEVTTIGEDAFYRCDSITTVYVGSGLKTVEGGNFSYCKSLENVEFHCKKIENWFYQIKSINTITIGNEVETIGESSFFGCTGLTSVSIPNSVKNIGNMAFENCTGLTSLSIPNSVISIGEQIFYGCTNLADVHIGNGIKSISSYAFWGCSSLTSITIPSSVTKIENLAFAFCNNLSSVDMPYGVTEIGDKTFSGCESLTSLELPNSLTTIGNYTFSGCSRIRSIIIPNSVEAIGNYAFSGCSSLSSVIIGKGVTSISNNAFNRCGNLNRVEFHCKSIRQWFNGNTSRISFIIGDEVTSIDNGAFDGCTNAKYYANLGGDGLLSLWEYGIEPYKTGTNLLLPATKLKFLAVTQSTVSYKIENPYNEYYNDNECEYVSATNNQLLQKGPNPEDLGNNEFVITRLRPESKIAVNHIVSSENKIYNTNLLVETDPISLFITQLSSTASSVDISCGYTKGDAKVKSSKLYVNDSWTDMPAVSLKRLSPETALNCVYEVIVEYGENNEETWRYTIEKVVTTDKLTMSTQQPKVISAGNVIVAAETNLDDEETYIGFEWRRIDWTDDFQSNTGRAYLFNGMMEGYIRNLYTEKLWKYRPFYQDNDGNRYYGDWVGIDPTNTSYFEPTVHTYASISVNENTVRLRGYAQRGTDNVMKQGFMYWKATSVANAKGLRVPSIPNNAIEIEASGTLMVANLTNLDYGTTYKYVAFVTTSENETFYGEEQSFKTEAKNIQIGDLNGDGSITNDDVTALVNIIFGKQANYDASAADVNDDGQITIADVTALVNIIRSN